jgi:hypothetical protein
LVKKKKVAFDYTHTVERERGNVLGSKTTVKIYCSEFDCSGMRWLIEETHEADRKNEKPHR